MAPRVEREHRVSVQCPCTLIESDGYEIQAELINISGKGFGLLSAAELVAGDIVQLATRKSAPHRGRLVWTRGNLAGGVFLDGVPSFV
jgi:hypothetical protein